MRGIRCSGLRGTSAGRLMPGRELAFARRGIRVGHRVIQPAIEVCRGTQSAWITTVEVAQIVITHTAANNQNTLIAQRRQGKARRSPDDGDVCTIGTSASG